MIRISWSFFATTLVFYYALCCSIESAFAQPIPAEKLFVEPAISMVELSPDGNYISVYLNNENGKFFSVVDNKTKILTPVIKLKTKEYIRSYLWLDSDTILMTISHNGLERQWFVDLKALSSGLTAQQKLLKAGGYLLSTLPDDSENVLYTKRKKGNDFAYEIYKLPIAELRSENFDDDYLVPDLPESNVLYVYDDLANKLLLLAYDEDEDEVTISSMGLQDRIETPLFSLTDFDYKFEPIGFISDTKLAVITDKLGDKDALHEFDLTTQTFTRLIYEHKRYDLAGAKINTDGKIESVVFFDHGRLTTEYFTDELKEESRMVQQAFPDSQFSIISIAHNADFKIIRTHASNDPGGYYLFDASKLVAERLFAVHPELESYTFAKTETFTFSAVDGKSVEGYLTLPTHSSHHTLLVMPHGGPVGIREYDVFDPTLQFYASRGFAILRVNFRGSSGFGKDFKEGGVGESGRLIESDINLAVDNVLERHTFNKTCAMGASYGGYSSYMLAIKDPQRYSCAVGAFGVYDLPLIFNSSNIAVLEDYRKGWENAFGKLSTEQFEVSPVYLAKDLQVPVLLIGGKKDYQVGFEQTNRMHYVLKKLNKPHEIAFYKNAEHGHHNWWGEWHEHALTYQFFADTLTLPKLDLAAVSPEDKKLISGESLRVAYSYNSDRTIDKDEERAVKFFTDSAELENSEALFVLGYQYDKGTLVEEDKQLATSYLEKSSALDNAKASRYLADKYFNGDDAEVDYERAFSYYELAKKQKYNAGINALLARSHCLGYGVEQDLAVCTELLEFNKLEDNSDNLNELNDTAYAIRKFVLSEILNSPRISVELRPKLHEFLAQEFSINTYSARIKEDEFGQLERIGNKYTYNDEVNISAEEGTAIGVSFEVKLKKNQTTGLVVHWVKTLSDGSTEIKYPRFLYGSDVSDWYFHLTFKEEDAEATHWEARIFDLHNRLAFAKKFTLVPQYISQ